LQPVPNETQQAFIKQGVNYIDSLEEIIPAMPPENICNSDDTNNPGKKKGMSS
jgi:hypothetical protein